MRVGTWNLENLFRPEDGSAAPTTTSAYERKLASLSATISDLDADLLAVQEVGDPDALADLVSALAGTWHSALADPDGRGIRVGILSRSPLTDVEQVTAFPSGLAPVQVDDTGRILTALGRPALRARAQIGGAAIDLVSVHLKSKLLSFPDGRFSTNDEDERVRYSVYALHRRASEAAGIRAYVNSLLDPDARSGPASSMLVVAGDLNDEPEAATTQILHGPPGSEIGTGGFSRPDSGDAQRLWNLAALIPEDRRYSRVYHGRRELIDHILTSHALVGQVVSVLTAAIDTPSVTDEPTVRRDEPGSDHRPVVAEITR
jgi:endonuclease/exonuclease/phosphatase family metal-dependent hydrolase